MDPQGTLHTSLPSQASEPWHSPGVCPGALHSDHAEAGLVLRVLIIRAQEASPHSRASGQRGPHRHGAESAPLRWPGTVSPPHGPSSHHVQSHRGCLRSVLLAPFTDKQTESRRGPGLAQDHKLAGGTSHIGGAPFPPVWFSKVAKEILRAGGSPVGEGWELNTCPCQ